MLGEVSTTNTTIMILFFYGREDDRKREREVPYPSYVWYHDNMTSLLMILGRLVLCFAQINKKMVLCSQILGGRPRFLGIIEVMVMVWYSLRTAIQSVLIKKLISIPVTLGFGPIDVKNHHLPIQRLFGLNLHWRALLKATTQRLILMFSYTQLTITTDTTQ